MRDRNGWLGRAALACSTVTVVLGCGGGDSEPTVSSGLPADSTVATLSESDAAQLCEATASAAADTFSTTDFCTFFAALSTLTVADNETLTVDRAMCESMRDECVAQGTTAVPMSDCQSGTVAPTLMDCNATVGQVEACLSAQLSFLADVLPLFSCTRAPTMQDAQRFENVQQPEACTALASTCEDLFFDTAAPVEGGTTDPGTTPSATGCDETCIFTGDGECDDGGANSLTSICGLGTDCMDCGQR